MRCLSCQKSGGVSTIYKKIYRNRNARTLRVLAQRARRAREKEAARGRFRACNLSRVLDRRAAWIYSPAQASPRKRIDHDCARGSRHYPTICNRSGRAIRKRTRSAPPAPPPVLGGERVSAQKIKTAPGKGRGSKNGFLIFGENWGTKKYA